MKASLFATLVILAAVALLGWKQHGQFVAVQETRHQVAAEARALGLSPEALLEAGRLPTKSGRADAEDKIAEAVSLARELAACEQDIQAQPGDEALLRRYSELRHRFMNLGPAGLGAVIADVKASGDIYGGTWCYRISDAILSLANDRPEAALALIAGCAGMKGMAVRGERVASSVLGKWAEKDPLGPLAWVRANSEKHPGLITGDTREALFAGAAKHDPKLALGLAGELGMEDPDAIAAGLAGAAKTPAARDALLSVLRGEKQQAALVRETLGAIGGELADEGFDASEAWLSRAKLSAEETAVIARSLWTWRTGPDTGKWIEWMAGQVPGDLLEAKVDDMVGDWAETDFNAAGEWINRTPEGPAKIAAVKAFARTVAPYEPESARQWADTLPAGKERDELLEAIGRAARKADISKAQPAGE